MLVMIDAIDEGNAGVETCCSYSSCVIMPRASFDAAEASAALSDFTRGDLGIALVKDTAASPPKKHGGRGRAMPRGSECVFLGSYVPA